MRHFEILERLLPSSPGCPLIGDPQLLKRWDYKGAAPTFGQECTLVFPSYTLSYDAVILSHSESS